jgi:Kef-type K+ transport system membrane component KefB
MEGVDPGVIILKLFILFLCARLAGEIFERLKQPVIIGELGVGILFGITLFSDLLELDHDFDVVLEVLAELGVIFLLFIIGLETKFSDLRRVGRLAMIVGILGVVIPMIFGIVLILAWIGDFLVALFIGTAMVATSIGITARVLKDMKVMKTEEARIIMGAAVIDDVLGMIVLTIVSGMAQASSGEGLHYYDLMIVIVEAILFVVLIMYFGDKLIRLLTGDKVILGVRVIDKKRDKFLKIKQKEGAFLVALILCLGLSAVATVFFRLAAIIGAFLAGMMFAEVRERYRLVEKMEPINELLVPFFFIFIGMQVNLGVLIGDMNLVYLLVIITALAIAGKIMGAFIGTDPLTKESKMIIGVGMMPRGEVGIIVASVGLSLGIIGESYYAVIIFMSVITTLIAPPILKSLFAKKKGEEDDGKS